MKGFTSSAVDIGVSSVFSENCPPGFVRAHGATLRRSNTNSSQATAQSLGIYDDEVVPLARHNSFSAIETTFSDSANGISTPVPLMRSLSERDINPFTGSNELYRANSLPYDFEEPTAFGFNPQHIPDQQLKERSKKKTTGPVHNVKYKAKLCKNWVQLGMCPYFEKCQFAHGEHEVQKWAMRRNRLREKQTVDHLSHFMAQPYAMDGSLGGSFPGPNSLPNDYGTRSAMQEMFDSHLTESTNMYNAFQQPGRVHFAHRSVGPRRSSADTPDFNRKLNIDHRVSFAGSNPSSKSSQSTFSLFGHDSHDEGFLFEEKFSYGDYGYPNHKAGDSVGAMENSFKNFHF